MADHVRTLAYIGFIRAALGLGIGAYLIFKASALNVVHYGLTPVTEELFDLDRTSFYVIGIVWVGLALLRVIQAIQAFRGKPSARVFGLGLAIWDIVNLPLLPVSTALGLYGLVVYRHPDTMVFFESHRQGRQPAS